MSQPGLFASNARVLLDDHRGRIEYTPGVVDSATAQAWFDALREGVEWQAQRRRMYDRDVDVPRLLAHYRLGPPRGKAARPRPRGAFVPAYAPASEVAIPDAIHAARAVVEAHTGTTFNSVGLNHYRDGRDSVAMHNDHLYEITELQPIALLSLGASRHMTIRAKQPPKRSFALELESGSVLLMSYATQLNYDHGVPKVAHEVGPRISLAFRVKPY